jgi:hypothetical protein
MDSGAIDAIFIILSSLGGIAAIIRAAGWAKAERIRAERLGRAEPSSITTPDSVVVSELKAMQQKMAEMHSTSHQFDISFDEALNRLEGRVGRLETKSAASVSNTSTEATLRNGNSSTP